MIVIEKVPFTLHMLVGPLHKSTTEKEQNKLAIICLQKKRQI